MTTENKYKKYDDSFINAVLSYIVYSDNEWIMRSKDEDSFSKLMADSKTKLEDMNMKDVYEYYIAAFAKDVFEPVKLNLGETGLYKSKDYGFNSSFNYVNGYFKTLNNLASAGVFKSKNLDGTYTLHVTFRGTDTSAREFTSYLSDAYLDISAYYDALKPLEESILEYAKNPENNISEIHSSGHSLGGGLAKEFLKSKEVMDSKIPTKGITFGSPGNTKKMFYSLIPSVYHSIKHGKFMNIGKSILNMGNRIVNFISPFEKDTNVVNYSHKGDIIPLVGKVLYNRDGESIVLKDIASKNIRQNQLLTGEVADKKVVNNQAMKLLIASHQYLIKKPINFLKNAVQFKYHDMLRYVINVQNYAIINNMKEDRQEFAENAPHLAKFNILKARYENTLRGIMYEDEITKRINSNYKTVTLKLDKNKLPDIKTLRNKVMAAKVKNDLFPNEKNPAMNNLILSTLKFK